ncbi:hypothetical protein MNBD_GAMMA26-157 [hydrothermal vent metagenome]|uniref:HTH cro/C1-type domain-containing protein n=1 Tax=hydrothermal vent metagenome TaxID=652676 RepID=A0A3B1AWG2_9ZZZZ
MAQSEALIDTLKQCLKAHHLTYAEVALRLTMSEANIKRMFASKRFTLTRLEAVCQLMEMELTDLVELYEESRLRITQLSIEQEQELVGDTKLLLVAVCARNRLSFREILENYQIEATECIHALAKLDRLKILDLLPGNRIKLRIDEDFHWIPNGPIEHFFEQQVQGHFLRSCFNAEQEQRLFLFGLLSETSVAVMSHKLQLLVKEFGDLYRRDAMLPLSKRQNFGLFLAFRPWELQIFEPLQRLQK